MNKDITVQCWDTTEFLNDRADIDTYLQVAFASGDPKQITRSLGNAAKAQGMMNIANETGLAREHLYTSFSENGNPTLLTLTTVMNSLGYQLSVVPKQHSMA